MTLKSLYQRLRPRSVRQLTRAAAVLALIALAMMVYSILVPRPLPVVFAMSVGQGLAVLALLCYLLAILLDVSREREPIDSLRPPKVIEKPDD